MPFPLNMGTFLSQNLSLLSCKTCFNPPIPSKVEALVTNTFAYLEVESTHKTMFQHIDK